MASSKGGVVDAGGILDRAPFVASVVNLVYFIHFAAELNEHAVVVFGVRAGGVQGAASGIGEVEERGAVGAVQEIHGSRRHHKVQERVAALVLLQGDVVVPIAV